MKLESELSHIQYKAETLYPVDISPTWVVVNQITLAGLSFPSQSGQCSVVRCLNFNSRHTDTCFTALFRVVGIYEG